MMFSSSFNERLAMKNLPYLVGRLRLSVTWKSYFCDVWSMQWFFFT